MKSTSHKTTLVVGASTNPTRYSYKAIRRLLENNVPVLAYSIKQGNINGIVFSNNWKAFQNQNIDTVTLYVGTKNQASIIAPILSLYPRRIIFNPDTENPEFIAQAKQKGIETVVGCTLVMLSVGNF